MTGAGVDNLRDVLLDMAAELEGEAERLEADARRLEGLPATTAVAIYAQPYRASIIQERRKAAAVARHRSEACRAGAASLGY